MQFTINSIQSMLSHETIFAEHRFDNVGYCFIETKPLVMIITAACATVALLPFQFLDVADLFPCDFHLAILLCRTFVNAVPVTSSFHPLDNTMYSGHGRPPFWSMRGSIAQHGVLRQLIAGLCWISSGLDLPWGL